MPITRNRYLLSRLFRALKNCRRNSNTTAIASDTDTPLRCDVKPVKSFKVTEEIRSYFEQRGLLHVIEQMPSEYLKRDASATHFMMADPQIAKRIAYSICCRLSGQYVFESDPGLGFMSEILLTATNNLRLCESHEEFRIKLENLRVKNANKVRILDINVGQMLRITNPTAHSVNFKKINYFYEDIPENPWNDNIHISYISTSNRKQVFRNLCLTSIFSENWKRFGRPEYYFLTTDIIYKKLFATSENEFQDYYRSTAVLFQLVFDSEMLLDGLPRKTFLPWSRIKKKSSMQEETCVLIRFMPKVKILDKLENINIKRAFFRFLKDNMWKRKTIISVLESFIPYCGPHFIIDFNITTYTEFVELSPKKLLDLFVSFSKLPDFHKTDLYLSTEELETPDNEPDDDDENT